MTEETKIISMIKDIQKKLENLWPLIDFYNQNESFTDYSPPIMEASVIVESIIRLFAYVKGATVDEHGFIVDDNAPINKKVMLFSYALSGKLGMPDEILRLIKTIQQLRNKAAHRVRFDGSGGILYSEAIVFAEAFDYFISWCILQAKDNQELEDFSRIQPRIVSFRKKMTLQVIDSNNNVTNDYTFESSIPETYNIAGNRISRINALDNCLASIDTKLNMLTDIYEGTLRIERKVDTVAEKLDSLTSQIENYQSLLTRLVNRAINEEETERIISSYADECTERIVREVKNAQADQQYKQEKEKLILSLSKQVWDKLDTASQDFLVTAKITYNSLVNMNDIVDYSGVCLLVTKAIEVEMSNRFCKDFLAFLKDKFPGKSNYDKYPNVLINKYGKPIRAKDFTLGSVAYVLCYLQPNDINEEQKQTNSQRIMEFVSEKLMSGKDPDQIKNNLIMIAEGVEDIRKDYRNPSAHTNQLMRINAKECFDLVLDVEKLLKAMIDTFDY